MDAEGCAVAHAGFLQRGKHVRAALQENAFSKISKRLYMGQENVYFGTEPLNTGT